MAKRKHIVCITFDFDSMSGFIARGLTSPTPISRGEFGTVGVERIMRFAFRLAQSRPFPSWSEVLHVLRGLGYQKPG